MSGILVREPRDARSLAASLTTSFVIHASLLGAALRIAPGGGAADLAEPVAAEVTREPEIVALVWPVEISPPAASRIPVVEEVAQANERDLDDGVGEVVAGTMPETDAWGAPAMTSAPLSADAPATRGFGTVATEPAPPDRAPTPAPTLVADDQKIDTPALLVAAGADGTDGSARTGEEEDEEEGEGGGLGSILDGLGGLLDGIKVSVGGMGGGGIGGGGRGGGGKGGCVPGIGGIIGKGGGRPGTVVIPQGPGVRTGIGGGQRFPYAGGAGPRVMPPRSSC